jgi:hypothetical protein
VAGYVPGLPLETRRASEPTLDEVPLPPEAGPIPAFPPAEPVFFPSVPGFRTPPVLVIPPPPAGVPPPPCVDNPETPDDECNPPPPPPPPPEEVPEPGTLFILGLIAAGAVVWRILSRRRIAAVRK